MFLCGVQINLAGGEKSPLYEAREAKVEVRQFWKDYFKGMSDSKIAKVGMRVTLWPSGEQCYFGMSLHGQDGSLLAKEEWSQSGDWQYISIRKDERLVGFHGYIQDETCLA